MQLASDCKPDAGQAQACELHLNQVAGLASPSLARRVLGQPWRTVGRAERGMALQEPETKNPAWCGVLCAYQACRAG